MSRQKKVVFWAVYCGLLVVLAASVATVGVITVKNANDAANQAVVIQNDEVTQNDATFVVVGLAPTLFDPITLNYKFRATFVPFGPFLQLDDNGQSKLSGKNFVLQNNVTMSIGQKTFTFPSGQVMQIQEWAENFDDGDVNNYPFDVMSSYANAVAGTYSYFDTTTNTTRKGVPLPVSVYIAGGIQSFKFTVMNPVVTSVFDGIEFDFTVQRAAQGKFFSVFIMIIMWALSLLALTLAVTLWMRGRKVEPPTLGVAVALLFALPGIRNTQPGSPPIGCISDVVSFFWAMSITAISAMLLLLNYIVKYQKDRKA